MGLELVLYPALAMVFLTFMVGFVLVGLRIRAVRSGEVNPRYFLLNRGAKLPEHLVRLEQHFSNLFELPLLFYFLVLTLYVTGHVDKLMLGLLWLFVASRIVHTVIHTTANRLVWRMRSYLLGGILLLLGWVLLSVKLMGGD